MVKQTINIKGITEKEGRSGNKYFLIETNKGKMSCFPDYSGLVALRDAWKADDDIEVNTETSDDGKFVNIRNEKKTNSGFTREAEEGAKKIAELGRKSVKGSAYEKDPVRLAVEVFVAIQATKQASDDLINDMECSCDLVKQAQKAFS